MNKAFIESLNGIKEIKLYNCEKKYCDIISGYTNKIAESMRFNVIYNQTPRLFIECVSVSVILVIVAFFILSGWSGSKIMGVLTVFGLASMQLLPSINRFMQNLTVLKFNKPAFDVIVEELKDNKFSDSISFNDLDKKETVQDCKKIFFKK